MKVLWSVDDAAAEFDMSKRTVLRASERCGFSSQKVGTYRRLLFSAEQLEAMRFKINEPRAVRGKEVR